MTARKFPKPFYAAAGAGEAIVEELRKLPGMVEELRDRTKFDERAQAVTTVVRDNVTQGIETLRNLDGDKVRSAANETASTLGVKAREARIKARDTYDELVERGQHVANGERSPIKVMATIAHKPEPKAGRTEANGSKPTAKAATPKPTVKKTAAVRKPAAKANNKPKAKAAK